MKYIVHQDFGNDKICDCIEDVCNYVVDLEFYSQYNDMLDEVYEAARICGHEYSPADALKAVDPIAYQCGYYEWLNGPIYDDLFYQLERMNDGDSIDFFDLEISCEEEEEEEE